MNKKLRKILYSLLFLVSSVWAQYHFDLSCLSDTFQVVTPNGVASFRFRLANTGSHNDIYELNCQIVESVPGWFVAFCIRGTCVEPGVFLYDTLNVGQFDTTIHISVYTTLVTGREVLSLNVRSLGDPTQRDSIRVYTQVGQGIEEALISNLTCPTFEIYPNPAKSILTIRVINLNSTQHHRVVIGSILIYDVQGKLIKSFPHISLPLSRTTVVSWDGRDGTGQSVPNGNYIITLIDGAGVITSKSVKLLK